MNYSKGISWIDDCRIPFTDQGDIPNDMDKTQLTNDRTFIEAGGYKPFLYRQNTQGRFPANLLCSDDILNDGTIGKGQKNPRIQKNGKKYGENNFGLYCPDGHISPTYNDQGTNSRYYDLDKWFNKMIDELL